MSNRHLSTTLGAVGLTFALMMTVMTPTASAYSGQLDQSFGLGGKVATDFGANLDDLGRDVALQPDGRIVVAGGSLDNFAVARYSSEGVLDPSFDGDGRVTTDLPGSGEIATGVVVQPDGKVVVSGFTGGANPNFALVRYNPNGSVDDTFDGDSGVANGIVTSDLSGSQDLAWGMLRQSDGKLVVVGRRNNNEFAVVRYNPDGTLDPTFDGPSGSGNGVVTYGNNEALAATQQPDGKLVVSGSGQDVNGTHFKVVRINPDGSPDASFSADGIETLDRDGSNGFAHSGDAVVVQPDGKIVVGGRAPGASPGFFMVLVRYLPGGTLDGSFDGDGIATLSSFGNDSWVRDLVVGHDSRIWAVGCAFCSSGVSSNGVAVRLNPDGNPISLNSFIFGSGADEAHAVAREPDGQLIIAGFSSGAGTGLDFAVARLDGLFDGQTDPSFSDDGKTMFQTASNYEWFTDSAIQSDGKIVSVGNIRNPSTSQDAFLVARYNPDGTLDPTFDGDGYSDSVFLGQSASNRVVAIDPGTGKIYVAGDVYQTPGFTDFGIARFNLDGSLDNTFGTNGTAKVDLSLHYDQPHAIGVQPDGKIVVAGYAQTFFTNNSSVARLNPNGTLDNTFSGDGKLLLPPGQFEDVEFDPAGNIVLAGNEFTNPSRGQIVRLEPDGDLDPTFDGDGRVSHSEGNTTSFQAIEISGGMIYATGNGASVSFPRPAITARFHPNGALDTSWGNNGVVVTDLPSQSDAGMGVAVDSWGRVIVGGLTSNNSPETGSFWAGRFRCNGQLDTNFFGDDLTGGGISTVAFPGRVALATDMELGSDGKILLTGQLREPNPAFQYDGGLARLTTSAPSGGIDLCLSDASVTEGNTGSPQAQFTAMVGDHSSPIAIDWAATAGTATAGTDFTLASGTLNFAPGDNVEHINVAVIPDTLDEDNETFTVNLTGFPGGVTALDTQGTGVITDDDPLPTISVGDSATAETGNVTVPVTLNTASGRTVTVDWETNDGSATAPADYSSDSGTLTFDPGETTKDLSFDINEDALDEAEETFTLDLSAPSNVQITDGSGTVTIADDDAAPDLSVADVSASEGDSDSSQQEVVVTLGAASGRTVSVDFAVNDGTATAPSDFTDPPDGTLQFAPGETSKPITIDVNGDTLGERNEILLVNLTNPVNAGLPDAEATLTILNDDTLPQVSIADASVTEGSGPATVLEFPITLSAAGGSTVSVRCTTSEGSAGSGGDYTHTSEIITFTPGETSGTCSVPVVSDEMDEHDETLSAALELQDDGLAPGDLNAEGTITDDDDPPDVFVDGDVVTEQDIGQNVTATFEVFLSAPSGKTITMDLSTQRGSTQANDIIAASFPDVTFAPGETSKTFDVSVVGDLLDEINEQFHLRGDNATNVADTSPFSGTTTIKDDDPLVRMRIKDAKITEGDSGSKIVKIPVVLNRPSGKRVTVRYQTIAGTAKAPGDFAAKSGSLAFRPGTVKKFVTISIKGDALNEANESFFVKLSKGVAAVLADFKSKVVVIDND